MIPFASLKSPGDALVYADWLDERGLGGRARMVRGLVARHLATNRSSSRAKVQTRRGTWITGWARRNSLSVSRRQANRVHASRSNTLIGQVHAKSLSRTEYGRRRVSVSQSRNSGLPF